ncbi:MAG: zinc ribbon domain-containing protein [Chloroflexota bacterium]
MSDGKTYEMLWDCQFCGTKGNLGLTHRYCHTCGAPQNPDSRYFPSDADKVAVEDHEFVGADVTCPACNELNSAASDFCTQCGSPLTEGARAKTVGAESRAAHESFASSGSRDVTKEKFDAQMQAIGVQQPATAKKKRGGLNLRGMALIGLILAIVGGAIALFNWTETVDLLVTDHEWERTIYVQEYDNFTVSSWRDSRPSGDNVTMRTGSCRQEQRSTRRVADGETCRTVRSDNGDGTFSERQECTTNYREEPVYDDMCTWTGFRWEDSDSFSTSGDLSDPPYWADVDLNCEGQRREGCERIDRRTENYAVIYETVGSNNTSRCTFNQSEWENIPLESTWSAQARVVDGAVQCDTLTRR